MKVSVKVFPIAGVSDATQELEVTLSEGNLSELVAFLQQRFSVDPHDESIMILHNGQALDSYADVILSEGDRLWMMPCLSGG